MLVITGKFRNIEHITKQMNDMRQKERGLSMINNGFEERSEDRRIRKTKKALRAALVRLLSKESIAEITIKELTDEADVHGGTFYHHYRDAFDLKEQVEEEIGQELDEVLSSVPESDGAFELLLRVLRFLEENRDVAKMLASESGCPKLMEQLCEKISARCMGNGLFGEQLRYGSRFCAAGIQGMIVSWVEDGMRMPPKEMAKVMETMMMGSQQQVEGKQPVTV